MASEGWVLRLRLQQSDSREKAGVDYLEDSLRGLVQDIWGSLGKSLACQRGKRSLLFSLIQSLCCFWHFVTPWIAAHQASLSITNSQSLLKLISIVLVMPSNHLIFCRPLLLLLSIFPSSRVYSNESAVHIRWPKYWRNMQQMKEQGKSPPDQTNEEEICNLPEKEFRVMIVKMIPSLGIKMETQLRVEEIQDMFSKDLEEITDNQQWTTKWLK